MAPARLRPTEAASTNAAVGAAGEPGEIEERYSGHADFINAWDPAALRALVDGCLNPVISRSGTPALVLRAWREGRFELVVSQALLGELGRALRYPKLEARVSADHSSRFIELLRTEATETEDPADVASICDDPGDDYLVALAQAQQALLVSGDRHLLALAERLPIMNPRAFLDSLPA